MKKLSTYLISYDLSQPNQNYTGLYKAIEAYGTYCHCLDSVWLILTMENAHSIYQKLLPFIDQDDSILVISVNNDISAHFPKLSQKSIDWINNYVI